MTLMWVLGHGISSNGVVDRLARAGSACLFTGPESFCGFSTSQLRCLGIGENLLSLD